MASRTTARSLARRPRRRCASGTLLAHPLELLRERPGAAQSDLDDVVAARWPSTTPGGTERRAAPPPGRAGVGMGVEVDDREAVRAEPPASAPAPGSTASGRRRARPAPRRRRGSRRRPVRSCCVRVGEVRRSDVDVAVVDDVQPLVRIDSELHVRAGHRERDVLGGADRTRPEAGARPDGDALVERRTEDRDVGARPARRVERERHPAERHADAGVAVSQGRFGCMAADATGGAHEQRSAGCSGPQMSSSDQLREPARAVERARVSSVGRIVAGRGQRLDPPESNSQRAGRGHQLLY